MLERVHSKDAVGGNRKDALDPGGFRNDIGNRVVTVAEVVLGVIVVACILNTYAHKFSGIEQTLTI